MECSLDTHGNLQLWEVKNELRRTTCITGRWLCILISEMKYKAAQIIQLKRDTPLKGSKKHCLQKDPKKTFPTLWNLYSDIIVLSLHLCPFVICLILTTIPLYRLKTEALTGGATWLQISELT